MPKYKYKETYAFRTYPCQICGVFSRKNSLRYKLLIVEKDTPTYAVGKKVYCGGCIGNFEKNNADWAVGLYATKEDN